jgi:hypothetical protein
VVKRAVLSRVCRVEGGGHKNKKTVEKSFFFLSNMKFFFMKRLFYTAFDDLGLWRNQKAVQQ